MYTIREISERFELPSSTIRYYEEIGLLENVEHKGGYHRVFDDSHIDRLAAVECFKKAGLPLEEIKRFFEYEKDMEKYSTAILDMMKLQEQRTREKIENLKVGLNHVQKKIKYYSAVDAAVKDGKDIPKWSDIIE